MAIIILKEIFKKCWYFSFYFSTSIRSVINIQSLDYRSREAQMFSEKNVPILLRYSRLKLNVLKWNFLTQQKKKPNDQAWSDHVCELNGQRHETLFRKYHMPIRETGRMPLLFFILSVE